MSSSPVNAGAAIGASGVVVLSNEVSGQLAVDTSILGTSSGHMKTQLNHLERSQAESGNADSVSGSRSNAGVVPAIERNPVRRPQLRLVDDVAPYTDEINCVTSHVHSLHDFDVEPNRLRPLLARALIERFSDPAALVLDPCARFGTVGLEAGLLGRDGRCAERHPVLASLCGAKVTPADIAEVALMCQTLGMRRPVTLDAYRQHFSAHFDVETYRELVTLKALLGDSHSRIDNVVRALALSLLHGPSAGYFSVAAPSAAALSTDDQHEFNTRRRQRPDYRAVLPRLLKRAAGATRDGMPSFSSRSRRKTVGTLLCDPRHLDGIESASVDLVVTEPLLPLQSVMPGDSSWLRHWFVGATPTPSMSVTNWSAWINESLLEWARVLKANHRALIVLGAYHGEDCPERVVTEIVRQNLSRFFAVEGVILEKPRVDAVRGVGRARAAEDVQGTARILVLKRR